MVSKILKFVRFEAACFIDFLRREFARKSGKRGAIGIYFLFRKSTKAIWYFALGAFLVVLYGLNLDFIARLLFGNGDDGPIPKWLSRAAEKGGLWERIAELIREDVVDKYLVPLANRATSISGKLLIMLAITSFAIALISSIITYGLYKRKKWADYMVIVASFIYVPWEIYALIKSPGWAPAAALFANVFVAVYLIRKKNLFLGYSSFREKRSRWLRSESQT